jgi:hypothetical protein
VRTTPAMTAAPVPEAVAYVRDLLDGFGRPWYVCGAWAVDAWLGRQTRDHADVDITVFHHDQHAVFEHFAGWALVGHDPNVPDATTEPWNGRHLDPPAHIHFPTLGSSLSTSPVARHAAVEFEVILVETAGRAVVLNRELGLSAPVQRVVRESAWGLPVAAPEMVLFFKAGGDRTGAGAGAGPPTPRARDEQDFSAVLPTLDRTRRGWLRDTLGTVHPTHPWLARLDP